jgi:cytochrome P450
LSALTAPPPTTTTRPEDELIGAAGPSPAGPVESLDGLRTAPAIRWPRPIQSVWFGRWQTQYVFRNRRRFGDVWIADGYVRGKAIVTSHPDHVRSLFTAPTDAITTLATESPLAPALGPNSTLIANPPRHLPQRKLLLPPFHGEAIARYEAAIAEATEREIDHWPIGKRFRLAPRMQAITLDVIMAGIFGIEGKPRRGTLEWRFRNAIRWLNWSSSLPGSKLAEWMNIGHQEPFGLTAAALYLPDRLLYAIIAKRRRAGDLEERTDIMSLIMRARTEDGGTLSDQELRDELMTLVLAGHETTANQLAWTWERLLRNPAAYRRLLDAARGTSAENLDAESAIESTIWESFRTRPVIPMIGRRVHRPWRLGEYGVPADTAIGVSVLLLHHREDLYPDPFAFRPERWDGHKPGTYEWIPFGGGTRRCLGAALALAEMRVVLRAMALRLDLEAPRSRPEKPVNRNVTMIPSRGAEVVVRSRR